VEPRSLIAQYSDWPSCAEGCEGTKGAPLSPPILWNAGIGLWQSLPLFIYAFNCVVPFVPILIEMKRKRAARVRTTLTFAVTVCFISYCMCAFGGYLAFCDKACPNILDCYPADNALVLPARVALLINLIFIVPLFNVIVRSCVEKQIGLVSDAPGADVTESKRPFCSLLLTFFLVGSSNALACVFSNLSIILGLTGAVGGSILVWILPGLFVLKMLKFTGGKAALYGVVMSPLGETPGAPLRKETPKQAEPNRTNGNTAKGALGNDAFLKLGSYFLVIGGTLLLCLGTGVTLLQAS